MRVLSLDSAGRACAACVMHDGKALAVMEERMERGQDARLVPLVQEAMAKANTTFEQLDGIVATRGPGSFTGLRIGLATARGFGLASGKPVFGVDRFSVYREQHKNISGDLLVVLESKRLELYVRLYPHGEAGMMTPEEIGALAKQRNKVFIAGDAFEGLRNLLPDLGVCLDLVEPEVVTCARIAATVEKGNPAYLPRPYYLRPPDVTIKAP